MRDTKRFVENEDWDRASRVVADIYFPHRLTTLSRTVAPRVTLDSVAIGPCLIGHVGWGADVQIECDYPDAYEVNIPLTGHLETVTTRGHSLAVAGHHAAVFAADTPSLISRWDATCTVAGVKFDRGHLEREADRLLGGSIRPRLDLPAVIDLSSPEGRDWRALVLSLSTHLRRPGGLLDNDVVTRQLAGALSAGLLLAALPANATPARPGIVKRVLDELHDDPARAWTAADMAELSGTSIRRLQEGFRDYVGSSPTQCLIDIRLERAHADLMSGAITTVSDVAARWGFSSASRFAAAFRDRYGVNPSELRLST